MLGAAGLLTLMVVRLVDIQLLRGEAFARQADDNRYYTQRIPAERGIFTDRYGQPLVLNQRTYTKKADSQQINAHAEPITQATALQLIATDSGAVEFGLERSYVYGPATAHLLGYVGSVTADNLKDDPSLAPTDLIGRTGLEQHFDQQLRGQAGKEVYEINAMGQRQRLVEKQDMVPGRTFATSLDPYLSQVAWQALGDHQGAVVILDGQTGQVLSLVSKPGFDPNVISTSFVDPLLESQRRQQLSQVLSDPHKPFFDRAVSGAYPPGSVFKLVTATGALEAKAMDAHTTVLDEGVLKVGTYEYGNWYFSQYGRTEGEISLQRAIARSNDIYFYKAAEALGPVRLADFARLFGYGELTGVELGSEVGGTVPDPAWKERVIGETWYLGDTYHMGIGQGDVLVTPLQVAQMTQALANHGALCQPSIVQDQNQHNCRELGITEDNLNVVLAGMLDVCSAGGTAYPFFPYNAQHAADRSQGDSNTLITNGAIACKTGTAEFGGADERGHRKTHGWLTSIIGTQPIMDLANQTASESATLATSADDHARWLSSIKQQPLPSKLVMVALVESDDTQPFMEGSRDAAPVIKQIVDWMYKGGQLGSQSTSATTTTAIGE